MSLTGPPALITPLVAVQPCRMPPSGLTSWLAASGLNAPARVKSCLPPLLVTKKPSPEIIMSVARPVLCEEPWAEVGADAGDPDTEADLGGVAAAGFGLRAGGALLHLREGVLELGG